MKEGRARRSLSVRSKGSSTAHVHNSLVEIGLAVQAGRKTRSRGGGLPCSFSYLSQPLAFQTASVCRAGPTGGAQVGGFPPAVLNDHHLKMMVSSIAVFEHVAETGNDLLDHTRWERIAEPDDQANDPGHGYYLLVIHQLYRIARGEATKRTWSRRRTMNDKIKPTHLQRSACVRRSAVKYNHESTDRRHKLTERTLRLGWPLAHHGCRQGPRPLRIGPSLLRPDDDGGGPGPRRVYKPPGWPAIMPTGMGSVRRHTIIGDAGRRRE